MGRFLTAIYNFFMGKSSNDNANKTGTYTLTGEGYAKKMLSLEGVVEGDWIAVKYELPAVTADCIIFSEDGTFVRTVVRGPDTLPKKFANTYAIPGGFVGINEEPKAAASREYKEETGLDAPELHFLKVATEPNRDPRQRTYSFVYWGIAPMKDANSNDTDEISKTEWTRVSDLVLEKTMAFDHKKILCQALLQMSDNYINPQENLRKTTLDNSKVETDFV